MKENEKGGGDTIITINNYYGENPHGVTIETPVAAPDGFTFHVCPVCDWPVYTQTESNAPWCPNCKVWR